MFPFNRFHPPVVGRFSPSQHRFIVALVLLSLVGYAVFWLWFPLVPFYRQVPLSDVRTFSPSLLAGGGYGLLLLVLYGLYWLAFQQTQAGLQLRLRVILGTAVLFSLPLLYTYPINATDVFRYFIYGRISALYHANPYLTPPGAFPQDPLLPLAGEWASETSPYGPVWELGATAVAHLAGNNLYTGLLLFKLAGLVAFLSCGWLIWQILKDAPPVSQTGLTLLWAWNPALLSIFVVDAHNDALMIFWLLLGYWIWRRGYSAAGIAVMFLAVLTKPIAGLVWPFFFLAAWRDLPGRAARWRGAGGTAVFMLLLTFITFSPYGSPIALLTRLVREANNYPGFSPVTLGLLAISNGGALAAEQYNLLVNLGRALFLLLAAWLVWQTWHGRSPLRAAADIFFGYLLTAPAFRIWYAVWPFPWLLVAEEEHRSRKAGEQGKGDTAVSYRLRVGLWFLLTTQLSVIVYGHLHAFALGRNNLLTHLIGIPFTFGLPFLLAAWSHRHP
jgi:hypothetical protein